MSASIHATEFNSLRTRMLSMKYGDKFAFRDVNMTIHRGAITALVGPSGCGKTSFLMCLNRLVQIIPGAQVSGHIEMGQEMINGPAVCEIALRKRIGMIFQKPNPFPLSIRKNISLPLREHGVTNRQILEEKIEKVLRQVGLWEEVKDRLDSSAMKLSGGQQQRLCIARALVLEPEVVLFDEPCSALDPISSGVVEDLICSLRGRYTVVIVTHNLAQAQRIADYLAFFWMQGGSGSLVEFGPAQEMFLFPKVPLTQSYLKGWRG